MRETSDHISGLLARSLLGFYWDPFRDSLNGIRLPLRDSLKGMRVPSRRFFEGFV